MREMCTLRTPYRCKKCNQDMLFFTTADNMLIDYKGLMTKGRDIFDIKEYLYKKRVRYLKCISCGDISIIDWSCSYPEQLKDREAIDKFGV